VVISSHVLAEVAQTVDRVVIVNQGRLRFAGPLADVTRDGESLESAFLQLTT
jgi:ABC-2 type transport system ATP-binding protein